MGRVLAVFISLVLAVGIAVIVLGMLFLTNSSVEYSEDQPMLATVDVIDSATMAVPEAQSAPYMERPTNAPDVVALATEHPGAVRVGSDDREHETMRALAEYREVPSMEEVRRQESMVRTEVAMAHKGRLPFFAVVMAIPFLFAGGVLALILIFRSRSNRVTPGGCARTVTANEAQATQELHRLQQRLAERVEALETILMDKFEKRNDPS